MVVAWWWRGGGVVVAWWWRGGGVVAGGVDPVYVVCQCLTVQGMRTWKPPKRIRSTPIFTNCKVLLGRKICLNMKYY